MHINGECNSGKQDPVELRKRAGRNVLSSSFVLVTKGYYK